MLTNQNYDNMNNMERGNLRRSKEYQQSLLVGIQELDFESILEIAEIISGANFIWIFGNGGSASTAEHFANDLNKFAGSRAIALTQIPIVTAYANDESYDKVFIRQLDGLMQDGDVAVGISCSGRSANVLAALKLAQGRGRTIALTGNERSPILEFADVAIAARANDIRQQEDIHLVICHMIAGLLKEKLDDKTYE
jgi:D-sedoheptulose 7-phosphate isomerase